MNSFYIGSKLMDSAFWKKVDILAAFIGIVLSSILSILKVFNVSLPMDEGHVIVVAGAIAAILLAFHSILTVLTSEKVGLKKKD